MIIENTKTTSIEPLEKGVYIGICSGIIDLGIQENDTFKTRNERILIQWTIQDEYVDVNGTKMPRVISKQYTASIGDNSNFRKDLEAWSGRQILEKSFDTDVLLGKPCQLGVIVKERKGKSDINEINNILQLQKGMVVKKIDEASIINFDMNKPETFKEYERIPGWIKNTIKNALNYESSGLKKYVEENVKEENNKNDEASYVTVEDTDELPF